MKSISDSLTSFTPSSKALTGILVVFASLLMFSSAGYAATGPTFQVSDLDGSGDQADIGWTSSVSSTGNHSVHVESSQDTRDYSAVIVPAGFELTSSSSIRYEGYRASGSDVPARDETFVYLDTTGDGEVDSILWNHYGTDSDATDEWLSVNWGLNNSEESPQNRERWTNLSSGNKVDITQFYGDADVLYVGLAAGTTGTKESVDVYFDNLEANGHALLDDDAAPIAVRKGSIFDASIQDGVDAALSGDTVKVEPGTYDGEIDVDKSLTLVSTSGSSQTTIDARGMHHGLHITASDVTVDGFEVVGNESTVSGISVKTGTDSNPMATSGVTIKNNNIHGMAKAGGKNNIWSFGVISWGDNTLTDFELKKNDISDIGSQGSVPGVAMSLEEVEGSSPGDGVTVSGNTVNNIQSASVSGLGQIAGTGIAVQPNSGDSSGAGSPGALVQDNDFSSTLVGVTVPAALSGVNVDENQLAAVNITFDGTELDTYFTSLQSAINSADDSGDTVRVLRGSYDGEIDINKPLTVTSTAGASQTTVDATGMHDGFQVMSSGVTIDGFEIEGDASTTTGISILTSQGATSDITISNNNIHGMAKGGGPGNQWSWGILSWGTNKLSDIQVTGNQISNIGSTPGVWGVGMSLEEIEGSSPGAGATVTGNTVSNIRSASASKPGVGVALQPGNGTSGSGSNSNAGTAGAIVQGNSFSNTPIGITIPAGPEASNIDENHLAAVDVTSNGLEQALYFTSIQSAISAADDAGDTVKVLRGTYNEHVTVDKALTIKGPNAGDDARDGQSNSPAVVGASSGAFTLQADGVVINGFELAGVTNGDAAVVTDPAHSGYEVINNYVHSNDLGVEFRSDGNTQSVVRHNLFENNDNDSNSDVSKAINTGFGDNSAGLSNAVIEQNEFVGHTEGSNSYSVHLIAGEGHSDVEIDNNQMDSSIVLNNVTGLRVADNTVDMSNDGDSTSAVFVGGSVDQAELTGNTLKNADRGLGVFDVFAGPNGQIDVVSNTFENNDVQVNDDDKALDMQQVLSNNTFDRAVVVSGSPLHHTIWSDIQDGVDAAEANDTVEVLEGIYEEQVSGVPENVTVTSRGDTEDTVVDSNTGTAFTLSASNVLDGFKLISENGAGVYSGSTVKVRNNLIVDKNPAKSSGNYGIRLEHSANGSEVTDNTFRNQEHGILSSANDLLVEDNRFVNGTTDGVLISTGPKPSKGFDVTGVEIVDNEFLRNANGVILLEKQDNDIIRAEIHRNKFGSEDHGVLTLNDGEDDYVNATQNYWGHPSGPNRTVNGSFAGAGARVVGDVEFVPWFPTAAMTGKITTAVVGPGKPVNVDSGNVRVTVNASDHASVQALELGSSPSGNPSNRGFVGGVNVTVTNGTGDVESSGTIRVSYDESELNARGLDEQSMSVYFLNPAGNWESVGGTVHSDQDFVEAEVPHFSVFGLFAGEQDTGGDQGVTDSGGDAGGASPEEGGGEESTGGGGGGGTPVTQPEEEEETAQNETQQDTGGETGEGQDTGGEEETPDEDTGPENPPGPTGLFAGGASDMLQGLMDWIGSLLPF